MLPPLPTSKEEKRKGKEEEPAARTTDLVPSLGNRFVFHPSPRHGGDAGLGLGPQLSVGADLVLVELLLADNPSDGNGNPGETGAGGLGLLLILGGGSGLDAPVKHIVVLEGLSHE